MKKILSIIFAVILSCTAMCTMAFAQTLGMPNPWTDCKTLADASQVAGFSMTAPDTIGAYQKDAIQATKNSPSTIQVFYQKKSSPSDTLLIRKARGVQSRLDGDYNNYKVTQYRILNHKIVKMRSDKAPTDNQKNYGIHVVNYYSGGYTYSISSNLGLTVNQVKTIMNQIH